MDIDDWRRKIDVLNEELLALLNERAKCALEIGRLKQEAGQPMYAPEREAAVLSHLKERNEGPLTNSAIHHIFQAIITESRQLEQDEHEGGERDGGN
jgi:chorismate mutase-like protein